jgi:ATP-dependent Clp protease protease subunit
MAETTSGPGSGWSQLENRLFDRRLLLVAGVLTVERASHLSAQLLTLDASGDDAITLQLESSGGSPDAALGLMDVIELLGVPLHVHVVGLLGGAGVGVLAVATHRVASLNARIRLDEPSESFAGSARQVEAWAALRRDQWRVFCQRVALACRRPIETVEDDMRRGRYLDAEEAKSYGLIDEIARPDAEIHRLPGRPIGFGPRP